MKKSRFNVEVRRDDGSLLLYNTLHGSLSELSAEEAREVISALDDPEVAAPAVRQFLVAQRHIVEDDRDELAEVRERRSRGISDSNRLDVIVLSTMDCNFGCEYCYETREPGSRMSAETERRLTSLLDREMPRSRLTILQWFGGEPLLDTGLICRVSRHAREVSEQSGNRLALHITTNGYLLRGWRREELLAAGVRDFQITLDGPPDTHDRMRPLRSGRASFATIFTNIQETVRVDPTVGMSLRVNVNHTNIDRIVEMLLMFETDVRPRLRLVLEPIFGDDTLSATANIPPRELSSALGHLYEQASDLGFDVSAWDSGVLTGRSTYCYAERERQFVIKNDGSVFKCATADFSASNRLAQLGPDGRVESADGRLDRWMAAGDDFPAACQGCVYLPLCMGGCRKVQFESPDKSCTLVPSNAHYVLKQIGLEGAPVALLDAHAESRRGGENQNEDHFAAAP